MKYFKGIRAYKVLKTGKLKRISLKKVDARNPNLKLYFFDGKGQYVTKEYKRLKRKEFKSFYKDEYFQTGKDKKLYKKDTSFLKFLEIDRSLLHRVNRKLKFTRFREDFIKTRKEIELKGGEKRQEYSISIYIGEPENLTSITEKVILAHYQTLFNYAKDLDHLLMYFSCFVINQNDTILFRHSTVCLEDSNIKQYLDKQVIYIIEQMYKTIFKVGSMKHYSNFDELTELIENFSYTFTISPQSDLEEGIEHKLTLKLAVTLIHEN